MTRGGSSDRREGNFLRIANNLSVLLAYVSSAFSEKYWGLVLCIAQRRLEYNFHGYRILSYFGICPILI
jgi:hypothetical protein